MAQTITAIGGESLCGGVVVSEVEVECGEVEEVECDEVVVRIETVPFAEAVGTLLLFVGYSTVGL